MKNDSDMQLSLDFGRTTNNSALGWQIDLNFRTHGL